MSGTATPPPISPKDRFVTIYGRNPVLEALGDTDLVVDKVLLADTAHGPHISEIRSAARARGVPVQVVGAERVKKIAGNGKQDQGVCADVVAPRMRPLDLALAAGLHGPVLVLDGITTPANVGMILRTATAAGFAGIVVPRRGVASIDPLVVKASAGVAFKAPILKVATTVDAVSALAAHGYRIAGLDAQGTTDLFSADLPRDTAYVMGGETAGLGAEVSELVDTWVSIPMAGDVESLNVSAAAAVLCFDVVRRGARRPSDPPGPARR
ncbi:MAG TPA: RNA methyltransferase [Phycicoccus elongatus]|jgi:23S rRNA (guanosine2251-2'-O)-methyltransferase|nr:RNA methyltransferase [Phycicoccus elongatus]